MIKVFLRTFSSAVYFGNPLFEKVKKNLETDFFKDGFFFAAPKGTLRLKFLF
jgi:hypothetical protein